MKLLHAQRAPSLACLFTLAWLAVTATPLRAQEADKTPTVSSSDTPGGQNAPPATDQLDPRDRAYFLPDETESIKPLARKLVRNTLLDQKDIWTSPFHMHRGDAKWWLLFGAATGGLIAADYRLSRQLPNTADQTSWSRHVSNLGATYTVYPAAAGLYIYGALASSPNAREGGVLSFEAIGDSLIVVEVLKLATSRERPLEGSGHGQFFRWGHDSFPSGHSIQSWAAASVIAHEYHRHVWVPILAFGLAATVSASRFSGQKHWASDIVAGGAMGWFIGDYVYQTHVNHAIHHHARSWQDKLTHPQMAPQLGVGTYALNLNWQLGR